MEDFSNQEKEKHIKWINNNPVEKTMSGFDIAGAYDGRGRWNYDEDIFLGIWGK